MLTQQDFLKSLQQKLKKRATSDDVIAAMATIREKLTAANNLRVVMATDVHSLPHPSPLKPWSNFLPQSNRMRYSVHIHMLVRHTDNGHYIFVILQFISKCPSKDSPSSRVPFTRCWEQNNAGWGGWSRVKLHAPDHALHLLPQPS